MDGQAAIELERPRSIPELLGASFNLYFRVPVLFLALAAVVVVPYESIVLLITGAGPLALGRTGFVISQLVSLADFFLVLPLISALHVHAVREVGDGGRPRFLPTFRQSLPALPIVAVATGISWVGITIGSLLIIPGVLLLARWAVVAQTAALERGGWIDPFRRSAVLTEGERWHAFWVIAVAGAITFVPWLILRGALGHTTTTVSSFAAGTALQVVMRSFEALVAALLYFDLKGRHSIEEVEPARTAPTEDGRASGWYIDPLQPTRMRYWASEGDEPGWSRRTAKTPKPLLREWQELRRTEPAPPAMATDEHTGHSLDPDLYTDEGRPPGWYVDPDQPWRMRYWRRGEHQGWSKETTKTPEKAQSEWRDLRWRR